MANPIVHWEVIVGDSDKAKTFYTSVFDWKVEDSPAFPGYSMVDAGEKPGGAIMVKPESAPGFSLNVYFGVDDVQQTLTRAVQAGGTLLVPATPIEGIGEWGMFADPDGIPVGVFHSRQIQPS